MPVGRAAAPPSAETAPDEIPADEHEEERKEVAGIEAEVDDLVEQHPAADADKEQARHPAVPLPSCMPQLQRADDDEHHRPVADVIPRIEDVQVIEREDHAERNRHQPEDDL